MRSKPLTQSNGVVVRKSWIRKLPNDDGDDDDNNDDDNDDDDDDDDDDDIGVDNEWMMEYCKVFWTFWIRGWNPLLLPFIETSSAKFLHDTICF